MLTSSFFRFTRTNSEIGPFEANALGQGAFLDHGCVVEPQCFTAAVAATMIGRSGKGVPVDTTAFSTGAEKSCRRVLRSGAGSS